MVANSPSGPAQQQEVIASVQQQPKQPFVSTTEQGPSAPQHVDQHQHQKQDDINTTQAPVASQGTASPQPGTSQNAQVQSQHQQQTPAQVQGPKQGQDHHAPGTTTAAELLKQAKLDQLKAASKAQGSNKPSEK